MAFFLTQFYFQIIVKRQLNPNKADLFEGSFSWGRERGGRGGGGVRWTTPAPPPFQISRRTYPISI